MNSNDVKPDDTVPYSDKLHYRAHSVNGDKVNAYLEDKNGVRAITQLVVVPLKAWLRMRDEAKSQERDAGGQ